MSALDKASKASDKASQSVEKQGKAARFASGPHQRLAELMRQLPRAQAQGNGAAAADISLAIRRAQKQIGAGGQKSFGTKLGTLIRSSRIGDGGGLMPLVGQLLDLLGPEGALVATLGGGAIKAAQAIYQMTEASAKAAQQFASLQFSTGSTGRETGQIGALGGALGMSPAEVGGLSAQLQQAITTDPISMNEAARAGVNNMAPRGFGQVDEGQNLLKIADYLRSIKSDSDAIQAARRLGPVGEALLPARQMSDDQWRQVQASSATTADINGSDQLRKAANFNSASYLWKQALDNLWGAVSSGTMAGFTQFLNAAATGINNIAEVVRRNPWLQGALVGLTPAGVLGPGGSATQKNTEALDRNTKAVNDAFPGSYGHGDNTSRAVPSAFGYGNGFALHQQLMQSGALTLGALT
jgi:hypothetical protein